MGSIPVPDHVRFVVDIPYHCTNTPYSPQVPEIGSTGKKCTFMNLIDNGIIIIGGGGGREGISATPRAGRSGARMPVGGEKFFFSQKVLNGIGVHSASYSMGIMVL